MVSGISSVAKGIGNVVTTIASSIGDLLKSVGGWFADLFGYLADLLSYINPFSDNFILKVALIPSDGFFGEYFAELKGIVTEKFAVVGQIRDTINALNSAIGDNVLGNDFTITIDLSNYGIGKQDIVSMTAIHYYGEKVKFWISGFIYFLVAMWLYRKFSSVLGVGK